MSRGITAYDGERPQMTVWLKENRRQWEIWMDAGIGAVRIGSVYDDNGAQRWKAWGRSRINADFCRAIVTAISGLVNRRSR